MKLEDVVGIVDVLNERSGETAGCTAWSVQAAGGAIQVFLNNTRLWDSEEDEREEIGTCETCSGTGKEDATAVTTCGQCGGTGKDRPFEPLIVYLPRAAFQHALEVIEMTRPRSDLSEDLPHDRPPSKTRGYDAWLKLLQEARDAIEQSMHGFALAQRGNVKGLAEPEKDWSVRERVQSLEDTRERHRVELRELVSRIADCEELSSA